MTNPCATSIGSNNQQVRYTNDKMHYLTKQRINNNDNQYGRMTESRNNMNVNESEDNWRTWPSHKVDDFIRRVGKHPEELEREHYRTTAVTPASTVTNSTTETNNGLYSYNVANNWNGNSTKSTNNERRFIRNPYIRENKNTHIR